MSRGMRVWAPASAASSSPQTVNIIDKKLGPPPYSMHHHHSRIAWSRSGLIAYIDGQRKVYVTWLQCVDGEKWDYVPPVHIQAAAESRPVNLSWSTTNFDLAVADELGRVHIVSISPSGVPTNQIVASAVRDQRQRPAELDKLMGMFWLGSEKSLIIPRPSNDESGKPWESVPPQGPFHPMKPRSALVAVNGNGMLRLLVQTPDYRYSEVDALMPGAQYVSNAQFVPMGGDSLLVIVSTGDNTLMAYEVLIRWTPENLESKTNFVSVQIHAVASLPLPQGDRLLKIVATRTLCKGPQSRDVTIRAVYPQSIVYYNLTSSQDSLHHSFFQLFTSTNPVPPDPYQVWHLKQTNVERHETEILDVIATKIVVVVIYTNGEVKRESLVPMVPLLLFDQVGLLFDPNELTSREPNVIDRENKDREKRCLVTDICLSPTTSCAAVFFNDTPPTGLPKLISVKATPPGQDVDATNYAKQMALNLATSYTCTVFNSEQCDDLLNVCWHVLHSPSVSEHSSTIFNTLASETQRLLNVQLSAPEDTQKVERLVVIPSPSQRWLSFLIALGTTSQWARTPGCYAAFSLLHLQLLAFGLTWTLKRIAQRSRAQNVSQLRLEIQASQFHLASMLGPVRWATDLIVRISQELYDASTSSQKTAALINEPNIYISLMFSGVSRYLLRYFLRCIRSLSAAAKNLAEQETRLNAKISQAAQMAKDANLTQELRIKLASPSNYIATRTLKKLVAQLQTVPIKLDAFEKVVANLEDAVKALDAQAPLSEEQRKKIDSDLIKTAMIPKSFAPLVQTLIESSRLILFPLTNIPNLYFHDTTWLGLDQMESPENIDELRKRVILPQEQVQVCTRCGMKSVVSPDQAKQAPQWLVLFQRHCVCGGSWLRKPEV